MRPIDQGVPELWSDIQTEKQTEITTLYILRNHLCQGHEDKPKHGGWEEIKKVLWDMDENILWLEYPGIPQGWIHRYTGHHGSIIILGVI